MELCRLHLIACFFSARTRLDRYINDASHEVNWRWHENSREEARKANKRKSHINRALAPSWSLHRGKYLLIRLQEIFVKTLE